MKKETYEIERKFLLQKDLITEKLLSSAIKRSEIIQTYLVATEEREERVRKSTSSGITVYTFTEKIGNGLKRIENEKEISEEEYILFLNKQKQLHLNQVKKTRYSFEFQDKNNISEVVIDKYPINFADFIVAEIEYKTDKIDSIPEFLEAIILKEVTGDKEYSNRKIAFENRPTSLGDASHFFPELFPLKKC